MRFNVARLLKGAVGTQKTATLHESFPPLEGTQTNLVDGRLRFMRTDAGVWVSGTLEAPAKATCSRCLQETWIPLRLRMDDVYYPTVDVNTGAGLRPPEEAERHCVIDSQHILDITESVRQYTTVGLPMKPLCKPDCAGLCPQCGVNLNEVSCSCRALEVDSRWLPLLSVSTTFRKE